MTNYSMQKGAIRNRKIRISKRIIIGVLITVAVIIGFSMLFKYWDKQDAKIMSIQYCWDSSGEHYVAPNNNCR